jgi:hypothetical protein
LIKNLLQDILAPYLQTLGHGIGNDLDPAPGSNIARTLISHGAKAAAMQLLNMFPAIVTDLIAATEMEDVLVSEVRYRGPESFLEETYGVGPVTLAGDAAHPFRPTGSYRRCFHITCTAHHMLYSVLSCTLR